MNDQQKHEHGEIGEKQTTLTGLLSPTAPDTFCAGCGKAMIAGGQNPSFKDSDQEYPLFCSTCDKWFHKRCTRKSVWSGECCPSCQKPLVWPSFFCQKCAAPTNVKAESVWPNFPCITCSEPTSMAAFESVGAIEVAILVLIGAIATAGLILTFVYQQPVPVKVIAGVLAVPLGLPWLANGLAALLAGMMPAMMNAKAPAAGGMRLQAVAARDFRQQPMGYRLRKVYLFYAMHAIPAMIFCVLALAFIHWVTSMAHSK